MRRLVFRGMAETHTVRPSCGSCSFCAGQIPAELTERFLQASAGCASAEPTIRRFLSQAPRLRGLLRRLALKFGAAQGGRDFGEE